VTLRHECAHGERLTFDSSKKPTELADDIFKVQTEIITLMHLLATEIVDHFHIKGFIAKRDQ
jgi:hypothetical protein